jgi:glycine/D-amino acid oxidase-like deaminating enzyme/nitrite reductase/ring-hydroxylating ferredoxin subunit
MTEHSGSTESAWMQARAGLPVPRPLEGDIEVGVCVIGAGISGLTTAYELTRRGHTVAVIDDGPLISGETERTTAHLSNAFDDRYFVLERLHGEEAARLAASSHSAAIDYIEEAVHRERIDCDFERLDGFLFAAPEHDKAFLNQELDATRRAGLEHVSFVNRVPMRSFDTGPALRFPRQGQFHPIKYLNGLVKAMAARARLYCHTHVSEIRDGTPCIVRTESGRTIKADAVVVATNSPVNDRVTIHTKQAPYRTYVVAMKVPRGSVPRALYWDTGDPYHYVRLQGGSAGDLLIVGGEDHKTGHDDHPEHRWESLIDWTRAHFPEAGDIAFRWSGQVLEPVDYLAFIGCNPGDKHIYIATGDSGQGMTHGTIAGMLLSDLITGRDNPWKELYDPSRRTLRAAGEFTRENFDVAGRYSEWATPGNVKSANDILPGAGAVLRHGMRKVAVYRSEDGSVHECSAVCPHMGCIVHWNDAEKTWDCPCHGSRFDCYGSVLNGPAITDLERVGRAEVAAR